MNADKKDPDMSVLCYPEKKETLFIDLYIYKLLAYEM